MQGHCDLPFQLFVTHPVEFFAVSNRLHRGRFVNCLGGLHQGGQQIKPFVTVSRVLPEFIGNGSAKSLRSAKMAEQGLQEQGRRSRNLSTLHGAYELQERPTLSRAAFVPPPLGFYLGPTTSAQFVITRGPARMPVKTIDRQSQMALSAGQFRFSSSHGWQDPSAANRQGR